MKRIMLMILCMTFVLAGCSQNVWETVEDNATTMQVVSWLEDAHMIQTQLPQNVQMVAQTEGWNVYESDDGCLEIELRTMLASDPETAIQMLSGFGTDKLNILQTKRFGMQEYQFVWVSETAQGSRLYRACLVMSDPECYAIVCSYPEMTGNLYHDEVRQVFSTFGLSTDEGV